MVVSSVLNFSRPLCSLSHKSNNVFRQSLRNPTRPFSRRSMQVSAGFFDNMGSFFSDGKSGNGAGKEGKNDSLLKWARAAKKGCEPAPSSAPPGLEIATFAGGCFWGLELAYQRVPGVLKTSVGYTAGKEPYPTYSEVCSGSTGHAEAVQMYYDPKEVTYERLLEEFFLRVDPTTLNRQGNDAGTQYRSSIYYHNEEQKAAAEKAIAEVNAALAAGTFRLRGQKVVTTLEPATGYYVAEAYHQQYLSRGGRMGMAQSAEKGCSDKIRCYG